MSINLGTVGGVTYQGSIVGLPIELCTPIAAMGPRIIRFDIPWSDAPYNASFNNRNVGVTINLANQQVVTPLEAVRSIKIDNTFNNVPVYVQFSDTLDAIACPGNAVITVPVLSRSLVMKIYGTGFFSGRSLRTSIFLSNAPQPAYYVPDATRSQIVGGLTDFPYLGGVAANLFTFLGVRLGQAYTDRLLVFSLAGERTAAGGNPVLSMRLDGVTIPVRDYIINGLSFAGVHSIFWPNNTTGTLEVISTGNSCNTIGVGIYSLSGATDDVPFSTSVENAPSFTGPMCAIGIMAIPGSYTVFSGYNQNAPVALDSYGDGVLVDIAYPDSAVTNFVYMSHKLNNVPQMVSATSYTLAMVAATFK